MAGLLAAGMSALSLSAAQGSFTGSKLRCNTAAAPAARRPVTLIEAKKKWEKTELNQNGNPVRVSMHVKTKDQVIVVAGADKGKVTTVVEVFRKSGEILCKDVNIKTKHVKPKEVEGKKVRFLKKTGEVLVN